MQLIIKYARLTLKHILLIVFLRWEVLFSLHKPLTVWNDFYLSKAMKQNHTAGRGRKAKQNQHKV